MRDVAQTVDLTSFSLSQIRQEVVSIKLKPPIKEMTWGKKFLTSASRIILERLRARRLSNVRHTDGQSLIAY